MNSPDTGVRAYGPSMQRPRTHRILEPALCLMTEASWG